MQGTLLSGAAQKKAAHAMHEPLPKHFVFLF
jgi:hypothetical protein